MYNNINEAARAHLAKIATALDVSNPGYSSEIATTLLQISAVYESVLDSTAKAALPSVANYNSVPDCLFRCLEAAYAAGSFPTLETYTVYSDTEAGTYNAPSGKAYNKVVVSSSTTPAT